ncbi:anthranilate synthase component 1 [Teredinibacter waterburyi]|uniref:anthranilate synthase component 1 n=1 Tax=Teredinibacter waterburyi TaxID=1500538 RepID=UPI00165F4C90|nr:anthranilate synthase component 1 [Teredinibacter waterburyi]
MSLSQLCENPGKVETLYRQLPYMAEPLPLYRKLCAESSYSMLLESAEISSKANLKSLMIVDAAVRFECNGNSVSCTALTKNGRPVLEIIQQYCHNAEIAKFENGLKLTFTPSYGANLSSNAANSSTGAEGHQDEDSRLKSQSVFDSLRAVIAQLVPLRNHADAIFLGGVFAYDLIGSFEALPEVPEGSNSCPDFVFYLAESLVVIDHQKQTTELLGSVLSGRDVASEYFRVSQRMEQLTALLDNWQPYAWTPEKVAVLPLAVDKDDASYCADVTRLKEHILSGDVFQVVPSRTFSLPCTCPHLAYKYLKKSNPSPYMFFQQDAEFTIFGASPESALKYHRHDNLLEIYPIAGTRPRGFNPDGSIDPDLDSRIELELRLDEKEKAEHLMLVDLARNDLARVCTAGTRYVKQLMQVDRYSQVMHLVSKVVGELRDDLDALHAYQACMNMGTLVGAPKVKAAELIRKVEAKRRGSYGGAVGYLNGKGDFDTCIVIRSAFVRKGIAYVQAGAGVVYDSDPQSEADETRSKARAVINAIQQATEAAGRLTVDSKKIEGLALTTRQENGVVYE